MGLPVTADVEQTSRLDFSRAADIRHDISPRAVPRVVIPRVVRHNQNIVPRRQSVPAIKHLPSPEEEEIQTLQQEIDESITVRPKEFGHNLSLPRVKYNKTKPKNKKKQEKQKQRKQQKKQSLRKKEKQKTDYQPAKHQDPKNEVLPKRLGNRHVPGCVPNLHNIREKPSNT